MHHSLRPLIVAAVLLFVPASPLHAQYFFLDANGDGKCDAQDYPNSDGIDSVDVWVDTSMNSDGSPAVCGSGEPLTISAYEVILKADAGTKFLSWTNGRPEFPVEEHRTLNSNRAWVGYTSPGATTHLPPDKYFLGRARYKHTRGCPSIFVVSQDPAFPGAESKFYSRCLGSEDDDYMRLGVEFTGTKGVFLICDEGEPPTGSGIRQSSR